MTIQQLVPSISSPLFNVNGFMKSGVFKGAMTFLILFAMLWIVFKYRPSFTIDLNNDQNHSIPKEYVNRKVVMRKSDNDRPIHQLRFKCVYNCCNTGHNKPSSAHQLRKVIGFGFRFLDFEIERYENNAIVVDQRSDETFYDVLKTIQSCAFSNHYCATFEWPIFINLRIKYSRHMLSNQLLLERLAEIFRAVYSTDYYSSLLGSQYSMNATNNTLMQSSLSSLKQKVIILCNYDEQRVKDDTSPSYVSPFLEYINLKTVLYNDLHPSHPINKSMFDAVLFDESLFTNTVASKKKRDMNSFTQFRMICPTKTLSNPTSIYRSLYNIRAIDLSSVSSFEEYRSNRDIQVVHFLDDVNIDGVIYS
jgi:hypothetical protein